MQRTVLLHGPVLIMTATHRLCARPAVQLVHQLPESVRESLDIHIHVLPAAGGASGQGSLGSRSLSCFHTFSALAKPLLPPPSQAWQSPWLPLPSRGTLEWWWWAAAAWAPPRARSCRWSAWAACQVSCLMRVITLPLPRCCAIARVAPVPSCPTSACTTRVLRGQTH
jgi:hypothetical protein